ncbi:MAG: GAF domain-containing protein [Gammaproteobacteria bacterium]|nr:GAF domain-containing protein [Gammaproteobacteria bacterium]
MTSAIVNSAVDARCADVADSARMLKRIDELAGKLNALIETTDRMQQRESLDVLLHRIMELITESFDADRSSLFLYDAETDELFSRIAQGELINEIRFPADTGIAGSVFRTGEGALIHNAYEDPRFNPGIDAETGYITESLMAVPLRTRGGEIIGVTEVLNKRGGDFTSDDQMLLGAFTAHAAIVLENARLNERAALIRREESQLFEVTQAISSELDIDKLLRKIINVATEMLDAERSTLFLHDPRGCELISRVAEGIGSREIRIPDRTGIAGEAFSSRQVVNIADAYQDERFNADVDRQTGFVTRSILCMPVVNKMGNAVGVVQVLNKSGGPFTRRDESRLRLLATQSAIALDNARLFREVLDERNYSENVLRSLTNGVVTLDVQNRVAKVNDAALETLGCDIRDLIGRSVEQIFTGDNQWILGMVRRVNETRSVEHAADTEFVGERGSPVSINLMTSPIFDSERNVIGTMLVIEDITREKRVRSTMARYMNKELVDQLVESGDAALGGRSQEATVLFTDIADFTSISERIGADGTVELLNDYFSEMVEIIFEHHGILDKYIGDAIMAVFGTPFPTVRDADNAVTVGLEMQRALRLFNDRRRARGEQTIDIRIGINTDRVVAGNIGSARRMDYTVIGDGVNLAARLESANKHFGTTMLLSDTTVARLKGDYLTREVDRIRVKGRELPVSVHEVLCPRHAVDATDRAILITQFNESMRVFRQRNWQRAQSGFQELLTRFPEDGPTLMFSRRAAHYATNPPGDDWDGVWELEGK